MSPWYDDSWRDTYDEWKLRSPYDEAPWEDEREECEHEGFDVDWDGRASCDRCDHHWWLDPAQLAAYQRLEREYAREQRRYNSWYMRAWRWLEERLPRRREKFPTLDENIPF